ncbi:MAG: CDP-alcohol phosphatidyltransferase family protein [Chloroflexales bacterium]|nr:CDP-alcohol phosphatidyltransferase family protein [Chloroflexales bacterium]
MRLRDLVEPRELLYPSNLLTMSRLLLVPLTLAQLRRPERRRAALVCLALVMFTDAIDGPIARARGEVSRLGKLLDPIADKLLIDGSAIILSQTRGFPWWATGLILFRDIGILAAAVVVLARRDQITPAASAGKLTTALLTAAALLFIADGPRTGKPALYLAMVPFGLSFVQYGRHFVRAMSRRAQ